MAIAAERITHYPFEYNHGRGNVGVTSPDSQPVSPIERRHVELPRAASYTYLPTTKERHFGEPTVVTLQGFVEADYIAEVDEVDDISPPDSSGWTTPDESLSLAIPPPKPRETIAELRTEPLGGHANAGTNAQLPLGTARSSVDSSFRRSIASVDSIGTASTVATTTSSRQHVPSNMSFSRRFNRQSWHRSKESSSSRSESPQKEETCAIEIEPQTEGEKMSEADSAPGSPKVDKKRRKSLIRRMSMGRSPKESVSKNAPWAAGPEDTSERPVTRRGSELAKRAARPISGIFKLSSFDLSDARSETGVPSSIPSVPKLPKSFSTDRLPSLKSQQILYDRAAPMPRLVSNEKTTNGPLGIVRKKDELWSVFRTLDGDFAKFSSKSTSFKANVVRATLMPFLKDYAIHASNKMLRPEDLDRRASILNKWWTGLIEMLHGRNNQSISGTDRPVILDGISGIMERPEWRLTPSPFCPLNQRLRNISTHSRSNTSFGSSTSDFLTESVHHNVRNIFIQNLSAQMAFVVDKMSLRNASASLVTFCGKACAYAFMFVPGMADVLVRLWDLQVDTIRRVLSENGIGKFDQAQGSPSSVIANFPPALHQLGFASLMKYMRKLRTPPPLPLGTTHIQWWGHWLERWTGRESDLFYVFVKHFHILATDFLPSDSTKEDRMCAPGMLLVHAQILTNLDATIHRATIQSQLDPTFAGLSPTFDDVLNEPDAVASALPLPPVNATRLMAENRLIMLIRDFLSERTAEHPIARDIFAESFNDLLQAAARGTSTFDHASCYTLLDFLEEALVILVRYEQLKQTEGTLINSAFWQSVCKKMISSENTMTEIRLYAFLYTVWNTVVSDLDRKFNLCTGLLLDRDIFESRFNHWCPMVRAYYMRLLCWRVGRFDGEADEDSLHILETLWERLRTVWSYYLFLCAQAEREDLPYPTSSPCHPAPARRLLIVRTDNPANPGGSFLSFDGVMAHSPTRTDSNAWKRASTFSTMSSVSELETVLDAGNISGDLETETRGRGIGGFLRKIMGSRSSSKAGTKSRGSSRGPPSRPETALSIHSMPEMHGLDRITTEDSSRPVRRSSLADLTMKSAQPPSQQVVSHRNFCFKFSLEFHGNGKPHPPMRLHQPRLPMPAQLFLQSFSGKLNPPRYTPSVEPRGETRAQARYAGRALAEWALVVGECQSFFERRKNEGVPSNKQVETPTLGVEVFKRPS